MPSRRLFVVLAVLILGTFAVGLGAALDRRADDDKAATANEPGLQPTDMPSPSEPETPSPEPTESPSESPSAAPTEAPSAAPTPDGTVIAEPPAPSMPNTGASPLLGVFALTLAGSAVVVRRSGSLR